jgi:hypothetical protein
MTARTANAIAVGLNAVVDEVDDPAVRNACACVDAALELAVVIQARLGHLNCKPDVGRPRVPMDVTWFRRRALRRDPVPARCRRS